MKTNYNKIFLVALLICGALLYQGQAFAENESWPYGDIPGFPTLDVDSLEETWASDTDQETDTSETPVDPGTAVESVMDAESTSPIETNGQEFDGAAIWELLLTPSQQNILYNSIRDFFLTYHPEYSKVTVSKYFITEQYLDNNADFYKKINVNVTSDSGVTYSVDTYAGNFKILIEIYSGNKKIWSYDGSNFLSPVDEAATVGDETKLSQYLPYYGTDSAAYCDPTKLIETGEMSCITEAPSTEEMERIEKSLAEDYQKQTGVSVDLTSFSRQAGSVDKTDGSIAQSASIGEQSGASGQSSGASFGLYGAAVLIVGVLFGSVFIYSKSN